MAAQVLSFFARAPRPQARPSDWTQQELAEFYRVEAALIRAGIRVGTDRGLSDENEPWFVFYRVDDGDVVIHFARIDGQYIIAGPAYEEIARGFDFTGLVRNMVERHPLIKRPERGSNIALHPAALLVAIVGTAFFKSGEARAEATGGAPQPATRHALLSTSSAASITGGAAASAIAVTGVSVQVPVSQAVLILAAAMMAAEIKLDERALSPAANDAIRAAAASLDFGSVRLDHAPSLPSVGPVSAGPDAPPATPAQTISSVLALMALLSTLPAPERELSRTADVLPHGAEASSNAAHFLASPAAGQWNIDIRLASSGLPEVEAVQLVRAMVGESFVDRVAVIEVEKLPQVLTDLIDSGAHYSVRGVENVAPVVGPEAPVTTPATPPTGSSEAPPPGAGVTPKPGAPVTDVSPPTSTAPLPADISPIKPPPFAGFASQDLVKKFVEYFVTHTEQVTIMVQGLQVVIFDSRVTTDPGSVENLTSMSFTFFDGTSVNLVGAQSAFLHHDGLS